MPGATASQPAPQWLLSPHAVKRATEMRVTREQLTAVLRRPTRVGDDPHGAPDRMLYEAGDIAVVVNRKARVVVTVLWSMFRENRAGPRDVYLRPTPETREDSP